MNRTNSSAISMRTKMMIGCASLAILMACSSEQSSAQGDQSGKELKPAAAKLKEMTDQYKPITEKPIAHEKVEKMHRREQITAARSYLMESKNLSSDNEIKLISAKTVTWRSGALGCPKPGENYTQALVEGVLIILGAGNQHYRFHASLNGDPFYCAASRAQSPMAEAGDI